jgi:hypothetical protein
MQDGTRCNFFSWQANYDVLLIKEGFVTGTNQVIDTIASAIIDLGRALESHTTSIRETKQKLDDLTVEDLKQEVKGLKKVMDANEQNKKLMASDLEKTKADLLKLEGSTANKPRMLGMCSLGFLGLGILIGLFLAGLGILTGLFLAGHGNREEAFRRVLDCLQWWEGKHETYLRI